MITGVDNVIFSDKDFNKFKIEFNKKITSFWKDFIVEDLSEDGQIDLFYAKDKEMYDRHDDVGFVINEKGESCFLVLHSKLSSVDLNIIVEEQITPALEFDVESYNSKLILSNLYMYTLVTPGLIDECEFSRKLYDALCSSLKIEG